MNPPDSHNVVVEQPVVEPQEKTHDDMRVKPEEESADHHVFAERSKSPTQASQLASTMFLFYTFSCKTRIVKPASSRKPLELRGGTAQKQVGPHGGSQSSQ